MTAADRCPSPADLEALLLGRTDAASAADLERHLAGCAACAVQATGANANDLMVTAVRRAAAAAGDTPIPVLTEELATVFRRLLPTVAGTTAAWATAPAADPVELGRIGPYAVFEVLGAGGMGVVYRGFDPALERTVAIKVIRPGLVAAPGMVERFLAEARAAAKVEHDHIVVVHAVAVHDGRPCLVMPLLKGQTLEARLKDRGTLPPAEVLRVGRQAAAALAAAHAAGLVHRDIKPGNLWLEAPTGRVRVLDFGLAVAADTGATGFAGTPGYMAPEQVRGRAVDHRADLFSLGCVLYRASTGAGPFDADTANASLIRTLTRPAAGVRALNPTVPPDLAALIDRLLAPTPADRPESAAAVADELAAMEAAVATRRRRVVRRRWLAGLVAAAGVGGLAAWFFQEPLVAPSAPTPVEVTIATDPDDGPLILTGEEGEVRVDGRDAAVSLTPGNYTVRAAVALPGRVPVPAAFVVRADEPVRVKVAQVGEVAITKAHSGAVTGVAVVRDGAGFAVLSASLDRTLQRWEPGKGDPRHAVLDSPAECVAATTDGSVVLTGGGSKFRLTNPRDPADPFGLAVARWDGRTLAAADDPLTGHRRMVKTLAVSSDGRYAVSADADEAIVWNLRDGGSVKHPTPARVLAAAYDKDGRRTLTGDESGSATLWDATRPEKPLREFKPPGATLSAVKAVGFLPDGYATGCADGTVWLWDKEFNPKRVVTPSEVLALAVSPDGSRLLTAGADGAVRLWSAPRGELLHKFDGHGPRVRGVAFTPDGRGAVSGGEDRSVRLWRLPFE